MKLIGAEWAPAFDRGLASLQPIRQPCIVCGHPTGDCTIDIHQELSKMAEAKMADSAKSTDVVKDDTGAKAAKAGDTAPLGRIIEPGAAVTVTSADVDSAQMITVKETVWQKFYPENSKRPSYRLLFTAGQSVLRSLVERQDEINQAAPGPVVDSTALPADASVVRS